MNEQVVERFDVFGKKPMASSVRGFTEEQTIQEKESSGRRYNRAISCIRKTIFTCGRSCSGRRPKKRARRRLTPQIVQTVPKPLLYEDWTRRAPPSVVGPALMTTYARAPKQVEE